jgi:hypothetical protein
MNENQPAPFFSRGRISGDTAAIFEFLILPVPYDTLHASSMGQSEGETDRSGSLTPPLQTAAQSVTVGRTRCHKANRPNTP